MKWAHAEGIPKNTQGNRLLQVALDVAADSANIGAARIRGGLGTAPQASAEARFFSFGGTVEEHHILAKRASRSTRWAAVHASGGDGVDEFAVLGGIALENRLPLLGVD